MENSSCVILLSHINEYYPETFLNVIGISGYSYSVKQAANEILKYINEVYNIYI